MGPLCWMNFITSSAVMQIRTCNFGDGISWKISLNSKMSFVNLWWPIRNQGACDDPHHAILRQFSAEILLHFYSDCTFYLAVIGRQQKMHQSSESPDSAERRINEMISCVGRGGGHQVVTFGCQSMATNWRPRRIEMHRVNRTNEARRLLRVATMATHSAV